MYGKFILIDDVGIIVKKEFILISNVTQFTEAVEAVVDKYILMSMHRIMKNMMDFKLNRIFRGCLRQPPILFS